MPVQSESYFEEWAQVTDSKIKVHFHSCLHPLRLMLWHSGQGQHVGGCLMCWREIIPRLHRSLPWQICITCSGGIWRGVAFHLPLMCSRPKFISTLMMPHPWLYYIRSGGGAFISCHVRQKATYLPNGGRSILIRSLAFVFPHLAG